MATSIVAIADSAGNITVSAPPYSLTIPHILNTEADTVYAVRCLYEIMGGTLSIDQAVISMHGILTILTFLD